MHEKNGRERKLVFREETGFNNPGDQWMFGMLLELGDRVLDQVVHLPADVLNSAPAGSYLTPARVVLHLIGTDLRLFSVLSNQFDAPDYQTEVQKTNSSDFPTMETSHLDAVSILRRHVAFRREFVASRCLSPGFLEQTLDHPSFVTKRDAMGHSIWHWSFHSGHIGAVTLEQGYEYNWTSTKRT